MLIIELLIKNLIEAETQLVQYTQVYKKNGKIKAIQVHRRLKNLTKKAIG